MGLGDGHLSSVHMTLCRHHIFPLGVKRPNFRTSAYLGLSLLEISTGDPRRPCRSGPYGSSFGHGNRLDSKREGAFTARKSNYIYVSTYMSAPLFNLRRRGRFGIVAFQDTTISLSLDSSRVELHLEHHSARTAQSTVVLLSRLSQRYARP